MPRGSCYGLQPLPPAPTTATTRRRRHRTADTAHPTLARGTLSGNSGREILRRIHVCEQGHRPIHIHRFVLVRLDDRLAAPLPRPRDRKSTRLNSSHLVISYAVFCLKKKNNNNDPTSD